jgi:phospholipid/cholesterol/gamma-HCH transport system substrate-binding protein
MENKAHAFWAGVFTLGLLAAVALAVLFFNADRTVRVPYELVTQSSVTGLSPDADVRYRGLTVGNVQSIELDVKHPGQILIHIMVDRKTPVTHSTFGTLGLQGVTGIAFIQLDDTGTNPAPLVSSAKAVAQIAMHLGLLDQLQQRGDALLGKLDRISDDVDALLSTQNRQQMMATLTSLQRAADGVHDLTTQLAPTAQRLPGTVDAARRTLDASAPLMRSLGQTGESLQALSAQVGNDTLPRVNALATDARTTMRAVNRATDAFSNGPLGSGLLGGGASPAPGPGEPGFVWPSTPQQ